ncbi:MAG: Hsp20/alpha crystallin family protein [Desulfobacterales bacterium]|nr:Hsp20/alpha crystallin family protein [Desulfobacterales bacterium]
MAIVKWREPNYSPTVFDQLQKEMNKLFQNYFGEEFYPYITHVYPPVNLYEDNENLYLTCEIPGVSPNDIDIHVERESIQLKGERKIETEAKDGQYHRRERESGKFLKKISLPIRINTEAVKASIENGVLKVAMPKAEEVKPKKIQVKLA